MLMVAAVEFSIAVAQIFLALSLVARDRARHRAPAPRRTSVGPLLLLFAGWTLVSAVFSATDDLASSMLSVLLLVVRDLDIVDDTNAIPLTTIVPLRR
jgi:hypothetical protein